MQRFSFSSLSLFSIFIFLLSFTNVTFATSVPNVDANYQVTWLKSRDLLNVNLCYSSAQALQLTNHSTNQAKYLESINQNGQPLKRRGNKVLTKDLTKLAAKNTCIDYQVSIDNGSQWRKDLKKDNAVVLNTKRWFWFSPTFKTAHFTFLDEQGKRINASLPFKKVGNQVQIANTGLKWDSRTILGNLSNQRIRLGTRFLNVTMAGDAQARSRDWLNWLTTTAKAIEAVYGYFPQDHTNILLIPIGPQSGPIPWGEVQRGGYPSVHLFIDETRPTQDFIDDWTGSHELSHLFLPKLIPGARWMSEGVASYYQNVARARTGLISQETAWRKMKAGFQRGRRDFNNRPLTQANKTMHVYWGGAAYFFLADLRLRESGQSLDSVLNALSACCLPSFVRWSPTQVAQKLDQLSNTHIFTNLLENEGKKIQFPVSKEYESQLTFQTKKQLNSIFVNPEESILSE